MTSPDHFKTEKKLLHFGLDYLTLNLCKKGDIGNQTEILLRGIFKLPHDTDNTNVYYGYEWENFEFPLMITFSESPDGEIAQFHLNDEYLFQVCRVDWEKPRWKNTKYRYKYRLQFYGAFFNGARRGNFIIQPFFSGFIEDVQSGAVSHSVSRVDICADVSGYTPKEIKEGIKGTRLKRMSMLNEDADTKQFQTFYYGDKRRDRSTWFARVYDKLVDSRNKGKEKFYADYFQFERVTRIELEIHSDTCRLFKLDLVQVLKNKCLWGVMDGLFRTKYYSWHILQFLKDQRLIYDFESVFMKKEIKPSIPLEREEYAMRFLSMAMRFEEKYGQDPAVYLIIKDMRIRANVLNYFYNER